MQVSAEKQRDILPFQHLNKLLTVLDGTIIRIYLALLQQVVMGNRKKNHAVTGRLLKLFLYPLIGLCLYHSPYLVAGFILAGIQHEQAHRRSQVIGVTEGIGIPAAGLRVSEFLIYALKILRCGRFRRVPVSPGIHGGAWVVNIMVARYNQNRDTGFLHLIQLFRQFFMALLFPLKT